jgi:hypothetical protein
VGAPLAGALVTLAGPVSFGCPDGAAGAVGVPVDVVAAPPAVTWPAVGSTACGWAFGTVPVAVAVAVADALVDDLADARVCVACSAPEGRCAVADGRCAVEPHPAANTTTAIAVTPAARMR